MHFTPSIKIYRRSRAAAIALALLAPAATFLAGQWGTPVPTLPALAVALGADRATVIVPALALLAGLVSFHAASLAIQPVHALSQAALRPSLATLLLMPDAGSGAMLPALFAAAMLTFYRPAVRVTAILVLCGALPAVAPSVGGAMVSWLIILILLAAYGLSARNSVAIAANDNSERCKQRSTPWLGPDFPDVTFAGESSGEVGKPSCSTRVRATPMVGGVH